jgi:hypothetical protein
VAYKCLHLRDGGDCNRLGSYIDSSLLAGIDGKVAYKHLDACDGSNCNWLGSYINLHCCQIDCDQLGSFIDEYIINTIVISLDCVSMDLNSGFDGMFDSGFDCRFHLAVLGYQPEQSI